MMHARCRWLERLVVTLALGGCCEAPRVASGAASVASTPPRAQGTRPQGVTKPGGLDGTLRYTVHFCRVPGVECGIDVVLRGRTLVGDVLASSIPNAAVRAGIDDVIEAAISRLRRRCRGLSPREAVALVAIGVALGGSSLAGLAIELHGPRNVPLHRLSVRAPALPLLVRLEPRAPDPRLLVSLDVATLLSSTLGSRWRWLRRCGPRRRHTLVDVLRPFAP